MNNEAGSLHRHCSGRGKAKTALLSRQRWMLAACTIEQRDTVSHKSISKKPGRLGSCQPRLGRPASSSIKTCKDFMYHQLEVVSFLHHKSFLFSALSCLSCFLPFPTYRLPLASWCHHRVVSYTSVTHLRLAVLCNLTLLFSVMHWQSHSFRVVLSSPWTSTAMTQSTQIPSLKAQGKKFSSGRFVTAVHHLSWMLRLRLGVSDTTVFSLIYPTYQHFI